MAALTELACVPGTPRCTFTALSFWADARTSLLKIIFQVIENSVNVPLNGKNRRINKLN